ncbi:MAG: hypothetical protein QM606_01405 [Leucobacter sp.]
MMFEFRTISGLTIVVVGALALSSCSPVSPTEAAFSDNVYVDVESLKPTTMGLSYDLELIPSNKELAAISDIVATGTVVGVADGPQYGRFDDEFSDLTSVVIEIKADEFAQGATDSGELYVSMLSSPELSIEEWSRAYPSGAKMVVYAEESAPGSPDKGLDTQDWASGRPEGAALYIPHPQGLAVQTSEHQLLWPLTGVTRAGTLRDALPSGDALGIWLPGEEPVEE